MTKKNEMKEKKRNYYCRIADKETEKEINYTNTKYLLRQ